MWEIQQGLNKWSSQWEADGAKNDYEEYRWGKKRQTKTNPKL